jgi:chaperone modulatory protein CbpM
MKILSFEQIGFDEFCEVILVPPTVVIEIVEHGIVEPEGRVPESWKFDPQMVSTTRKALRLHRDLEIDWAGIALALSLIDEVEQLRKKNEFLVRRLAHFEENSNSH